MAAARPTVLLTRPEAASRRFAEAARERFGDLPVVISPAMRTVFLSPELPGQDVAGLIFTSENAVTGFCRLSSRRGLPAWCVGERTARVARAEGFEVTAGPGDGEGLAATIIAAPPPGPLLWPHGADMAIDIAKSLESAGIETFSLVVYAQEPLPPSPEAQALLAGAAPVLLPLFSPRSARLVAGWASGCAAPLWVAAMSPAVAEAIAAPPPDRLVVAERPAADAMLAALGALLAADESP